MARAGLNPFSSGHSLMPRGLGKGAIDNVHNGRFDRLMPVSKSPKPDDATLQRLAIFMVTSFDAKGPATPDGGTPISEAEPSDENATIPAAYTYFGQFVDHDLTLDTTDFGQSQKDLSATIDFRTPALDLDCVYGCGPADQPYLYRVAKNGARHLLRLGTPIAGAGINHTKADLLRLPADSVNDPAQLAIIGDKRNDENKIVSQFQAVMISLHNKIYEDDGFHVGITDLTERFANAVKIVRWHYQWVVLHDFLEKHLVLSAALSDFGSLHHPHLELYDSVMASGRKYPFMPVEFSGGVYRLGHSMVRPSYSLSANTLSLGDPKKTRIDTFGLVNKDLRGFGEPITAAWSIDWGFFIDGINVPGAKPDWVVPQPSYRIDTRVVNPLANLPEFVGVKDRIEANLAYRNLSRGVGLGLPTGEEAAAALRIQPLTTEQIWSAGSMMYKDEGPASEIKSRRKAMKEAKFAEHFAGRTPLWFYILREAEWYGCTKPLPAAYRDAPSLKQEKPADIAQEHVNYGGQFLGPVGSHIVLETFIGLLWYDKMSFLHEPTWRPHPKLNSSGDFTLGKLIAYALD
jgi:hypothetical protein